VANIQSPLIHFENIFILQAYVVQLQPTPTDNSRKTGYWLQWQIVT